jgi:hypothetical protein
MNTTTSPTTPSPITTNTMVVVTKGCKARGITKGVRARAVVVEALGAEGGHMVKVLLAFASGRKVAFYARHPNRMADTEVGMNDGDPTHRITIRRA